MATKAKRARLRWLKLAAEYRRELARLDTLAEGPERGKLAYHLLGISHALVAVAQAMIEKRN